MFSLLTFLIGAIFHLSKSKKELIIQLYLHKKELEILKRQNHKKRLKFKHYDRIIFSILNGKFRAFRTPIPGDSGHEFRFNSDSDSGLISDSFML